MPTESTVSRFWRRREDDLGTTYRWVDYNNNDVNVTASSSTYRWADYDYPPIPHVRISSPYELMEGAIPPHEQARQEPAPHGADDTPNWDFLVLQDIMAYGRIQSLRKNPVVKLRVKEVREVHG